MFDVFKTHIDGLDAILAGGVRFPSEGAAFVFLTGGPGSGKTVLGLELVARQWLNAEDSSTCLYYSVEHTPRSLYRKLTYDFGYHGTEAEIKLLPEEVSHKLVVEARTAKGTSKLVLTQATPAALDDAIGQSAVDIDWILAEVENHRLAGPVHMVCVDNVGLLLTDLDYFGKRRTLLATRRKLTRLGVHGVFVQENTDDRHLRMPSAEEFSTDVLIELSFQDQGGQFKARTMEIQKARHRSYYRGPHHFSIAGRGVVRDTYLGARNERGPGIHVYPSVAAQLSIARDSHSGRVPPRGREVLDIGHPDLISSFTDATGPTSRSSIVLVAEPGTRYTYLSMRFLAAGVAAGEQTLLVSTKEDEDALEQIAEHEQPLRDNLLAGPGEFADRFRVLYLHPEFISAGKFTSDLLQFVGDPAQQAGAAGAAAEAQVTRLAFDNIHRLQDRFPLLDGQTFMIPALLDMLRYRGVTPLFVDLVPPGSDAGRRHFDPARHMTTFDHVLHLFLREIDGEHRTFVRVLKSSTGLFSRKAQQIHFDR